VIGSVEQLMAELNSSKALGVTLSELLKSVEKRAEELRKKSPK
jgi:hypothetical protein